jgi:hypothetical protein
MGKKLASECRSLEASIQLRSVALAYIEETRRLLVLLKTKAVSEESNEAFGVALTRLKDFPFDQRNSRSRKNSARLSPDKTSATRGG